MRIAIVLLLPSRQARFGKSEINQPSKLTLSTSKIRQSAVPRLPRNRTYRGHAENDANDVVDDARSRHRMCQRGDR